MVSKLPDRTLLRVAGPKVLEFLQGLVTADTRLLAGEGRRPLLSAAFLSPKGKVLADCLVHCQDDDSVCLDVHSDVASSLERLLKRYRLRLPLEIDVDSNHSVVASLTPTKGLHSDPRFVGLGFRGIVKPNEDGVNLDTAWHLRQRVLCCIPEGPADLGIDSTFPLFANMDLLKTVSFSKGCYTGQENTTRSKMRGAIRRRFVTVSAGRPLELGDDFRVAALDNVVSDDPELALPTSGDRSVKTEDDKDMGTLHSVHGNVGLCQVKLPDAANSAEAFAEVFKQLPPLYYNGVRLYPVLPPYCAPE